jgi:hypothetical protein
MKGNHKMRRVIECSTAYCISFQTIVRLLIEEKYFILLTLLELEHLSLELMYEFFYII